MAPMHIGDTLIAAEGERSRWRPRRDFGGGAGSIVGYLRIGRRPLITCCCEKKH